MLKSWYLGSELGVKLHFNVAPKNDITQIIEEKLFLYQHTEDIQHNSNTNGMSKVFFISATKILKRK